MANLLAILTKILEGVGQKKKFVAKNIFLANLWPILGQISYLVKFMSLKKYDFFN
jgi:hypothetical protein